MSSSSRSRRPSTSREGSTVATDAPSLAVEQELLIEFGSFVAFDEVGRGAAAGPVSVGAVFIDRSSLYDNHDLPSGLDDSKRLTPSRRELLAPLIEAWTATAVGHATPAEIDEYGIMTSLTLAAHRARRSLPAPAAVLIDGDLDWVNPVPSLLLPEELWDVEPVASRTVVRGDGSCLSLAAASIVAKVVRDGMMSQMAEHFPVYGWESNKGYLTPTHLEAIRSFGLTAQHRTSWTYPV